MDPKPERGGAEARRLPSRRAWLLLAIGALYVLSVPWYRASDDDPARVFGVPSWVAVAVVCYFAAACLNAVAWWTAPVSDELVEPDAAAGPLREREDA